MSPESQKQVSPVSTIEQLFQRLPDLPAIPRAVQDLIASMDDPEADISEIADIVRHDPTLTARALKLANSAQFVGMPQTASIEKAVTRVGLHALRALVVTSGLIRAFKLVPDQRLRDFWLHALVSAGFASQLAKHAKIDGEIAYIAALMHRIGVLLLSLAEPAKTAEIEQELADATPAQRCEAERDRIGVDHAAASAELARLWNFPGAVRNAMAAYAYPLSPQASEQAAVVAIASAAAAASLAGKRADEILATISPALLERLSIEAEVLPDALAALPELAANAQEFL